MVKTDAKLVIIYNMDVKFGKIRPNHDNFFVEPLTNDSHENFFVSSPASDSINQKEKAPILGSRINDFDSNILENNAYHAISDETFKVEHKINLLEASLTKINLEISALEGLGYDIQIYDLKNRKQKVEQELIELNKKYSDLGLGTKISGQIASAMNFASNKKNNVFSIMKDFISKKILAKLSKKIGYSQSMKEALGNLGNINSSVDELIKMQTPYGETIKRYEKLTAYLNKANIIHSQISRNMKTATIKNLKP